VAPGADRIISYDPPGAIGLVDSSPVALLRFNEATTSDRPADAVGALEDLDVKVSAAVTGVTLAMPAVVPGSTGNARQFDPHIANSGLSTRDRVSGTTLLTRDMSIQVILRWNASHQDLGVGNIITRGLGNVLAEFIAYGLQIDLVSSATSTGLLRWLWQDVAGTLKLQTGAQFTTTPGTFTMLTATRRWVSPTSVVLRYYIGDILLGEVTSADGSIGGGTLGATQIGTRIVAGADSNFLAADVDELMIIGRELTLEEVEATWLRITKFQPLGQQTFVEHHDQGFPLPLDPSSEVQRENRLIGQTIGFSAAAAENMRANMLPQRSYGQVLADWETVTRPTAQPGDSIDTRRARVLARMRQRRGVSIGGLQDSLESLIGGGDPSQLEFLAFTNTITDDFTTINLSRWDVTPVGSFTASSGTARVAPGAVSTTFPTLWKTCAAAVGGDGKSSHIIAKLVFTTPQSVVEVGVFFGDAGLGNYLLLGLRDNAGSFQIITESYVGTVSQTLATQATLGGNPAAIWLHLWQSEVGGAWLAAWSVTSATTGYTTSTPITHPTIQNRAGIYMRSVGAAPAAAVANFDDVIIRSPFGTRPFNAYVLLDSALGFDPDVDGSTSVIRSIKHAYTNACFIESRNLLCDTPFGCDCGPMGGI
jgi:hypothetical protein